MLGLGFAVSRDQKEGFSDSSVHDLGIAVT